MKNWKKRYQITPKSKPFYTIRRLTPKDIPQMSKARIAQEIENDNFQIDNKEKLNEYLIHYEKILQELFKNNRLIAVGAFDGESLVSLACYNLINFGGKQLTPYLCAVWTNKEYRGQGLAYSVIERLTCETAKRSGEIKPAALLTLEGGEAAKRLYEEKLGYTGVKGEMTFLGDVKKAYDENSSGFESVVEENDAPKKSVTYSLNGINKAKIVYSEEQFFSHPTNLDGKMCRILDIQLLNTDYNSNTVSLFLQQFFSEHRFCKFNVQELADNNDKLYDIFGVKKGKMLGLLNAFSSLRFKGVNNDTLSIIPSNGIMETDLSEEFERFTNESVL